MTYLEEKSFYFRSLSTKTEADTFAVVNFTGREAVSTPYEFTIRLVTRDADLDLEDVLNNGAILHLRPDKKLPVHGVLASLELDSEIDGNYFYTALLVPRLWQLTLFDVSEVYLDMTAPEILEQVLQEGGLGAKDYDLRLMREYRRWSYVCQYQETHLDFISRWMEREGIFYFFEQGEDQEKLVITDTSMAHVDLPDDKIVKYSPPSGLEIGGQKQAVTAFLCRQRPVPRKVTIQDFNHRRSPPTIQGEAEVSPTGRGELHIYGEHVKDNEEAAAYAKIRAEEILCRRRVYHGEGAANFLRVGFYFEMARHFKAGYNRKYLLTALEHRGSQAAILLAGVGASLADDERKPYYSNSFEAIEDGTQFRPERKTPKPRFYGTINAKVSAEGDGQYAEIDEYGRYKVKLPFDRSDRAGQKASRWIRMAQPFAGPDEGMHFPLRKGAEVILTFMDGDPDRPLIASAVPGAESPSIIVDNNSTKNMIKTSGGNKMHFEDRKGKQRILLHSPTAGSWIRIGSENDPISLNGASPYTINVGADWVDPGATHQNVKLTGSPATIDTSAAGAHTITYTHTSNHTGASVTETATRTVNVVESGEDLDTSENGVRYRSNGNMWTESHDHYCDYAIGIPANDIPRPVRYLAAKFGADFNPTGMKPYDYGANEDVAADKLIPANKFNSDLTEFTGLTFANLVKYGQVGLIKGDVFETHEGNLYDFGGHWDYNFGNGYEETFIDQAGITVNVKQDYDKAEEGGPSPSKINTTKISGLTASNTRISKTLSGNDYEYKKNIKTLGVEQDCQEEKYSYGCKSYEYGYTTDGKKNSEEWSEPGVKNAWKYDKNTGATTSYEYTAFAGDNHFAFKFLAVASLEIEFDFAIQTEIKIHVDNPIKLSFEICPFTIDIKTGVAFGLDLDLRVGGSFTFKDDGSFGFKTIGLSAVVEALFKASKETVAAKKAEARLVAIEADLKKCSVSLKKPEADITVPSLEVHV